MKKIKFRYKDLKGFLFVISLEDLPSISQKEFDSWEYAGEFTGLNDIHNKELWEGDIVRDLTPYADKDFELIQAGDRYVPRALLVSWVEREARFQLFGDFHREDWYYQYSDQIYNRKLEIIGNIYENPELIDYEYGLPKYENS